MSKKMKPLHIGDFVKDALEQRELTPYKASQLARISYPSLNQVINGKRRLSMGQAFKLSKLFGSKPDFLLRLQVRCEVESATPDFSNDAEYNSITTLQ